MQTCDGILLLAETPRPERPLAPLTGEFENLKEAFSILLDQRDTGPEQNWPVALLLNKWDRQGDVDFQNPEYEDSKLRTFLEHPDLPHRSLIRVVENVVKPDNVRIFPVSAFGENVILPNGEEVPRRNGPRLQSFRLEDPFVWITGARTNLTSRSTRLRRATVLGWNSGNPSLGAPPPSRRDDQAGSRTRCGTGFGESHRYVRFSPGFSSREDYPDSLICPRE